MLRILIVLAVIGLLSVLGFKQFGDQPLTERQAIESGVSTVKQTENLNKGEEEVLRVQLAVMDFMAKNGGPPLTLHELVPTYFDSVPKDPRTGELFKYSRKGNQYSLGDQVDKTEVAAKSGSATDEGVATETVELFSEQEIAEGFVNPNTMEAEKFVYDTTGKRDPYRPFDFSGNSNLNDDSIPPLERYTLGQLRCTAILTAQDGSLKALVEDAVGKGYTVNKGSRIGNSGGTVVDIAADRIKILESNVDFTGKRQEKVVELIINKTPGIDSKSKRRNAKNEQRHRGAKR